MKTALWIEKLKQAIFLMTKGKLSENSSANRYRSILRGGGSALISKGVSILAVFLITPLTLTYLGQEQYGLWIMLYSMITWLTLFDLGIANGLMNALSEAYGKGEKILAREYVSVAFYGLTCLSILIGVLYFLLNQWIDWGKMLNVTNTELIHEFNVAATIAVLLFAFMFPLGIAGKIYISHQLGEINNYWGIVSTVAGLLGIFIAILINGGLSGMVIGLSGCQFLTSLVSSYWVYTQKLPHLSPIMHFKRKSIRRVFGSGFDYFLAQIAALLLFQSGPIIIARNLGPEQVAAFQIAWMLFYYTAIPQQLVGPNIWAAIGEADAKKDTGWIKTILGRYLKVSICIGFPSILVLCVGYDFLTKFWLGAAPKSDIFLIFWMAIWASQIILLQPFTAVLGGAGQYKLFSRINFVVALSVICVANLAVNKFGTAGVIAAIAIGNGMLVVVAAVLVKMHIDNPHNTGNSS